MHDIHRTQSELQGTCVFRYRKSPLTSLELDGPAILGQEW